MRFLLRAGWHVTFLAREEEGVAEERHANRLRQMGVATYAGFGAAERLLRSSDFDLALIAFWEPAAEILPAAAEALPRDPRRHQLDGRALPPERTSFVRSANARSDTAFGAEATRELNTYDAADAVIAVSDKERDLLADFLGEDRVFTLPLAEDIERSPYPLDERRGMYFVGNFRHLPNREAVEYLCTEVLPLLDPELLRAPSAHRASATGSTAWHSTSTRRLRGFGSSAGCRRCSPTSSGRASRSCRCCTARA